MSGKEEWGQDEGLPEEMLHRMPHKKENAGEKENLPRIKTLP